MSGSTWTWIRHAKAAADGCFCGQSDPPLAKTDQPELARAARWLPPDAPVFVSPLRRAGETLEKIIHAGFKPGPVITSPLLAEQNFGVAEGRPYSEIRLPDTPQALAAWKPEGGESFEDVIVRVRLFLAGASANQKLAGVIAHAGVIRAALAVALNLPPALALSISIDPLSATALTRWVDGSWQVHYVNRSAAQS